MTPLLFTHVNFKCPVVVTKELIAAIYYSENNRATHIISNAGAIVPVSESLQAVQQMVYGALTAAEQKEVK